MFEPLTVTPVMVTPNAKGLLHFDTDRRPTAQKCLPANVIVADLSNPLSYILASRTSKPTTATGQAQSLRAS